MTEKKRYFKKEKKQLKPKRHKAKSQAQLKAAEKKGLRRGVQVETKPSINSSKGKTLLKLQFPKISRFITEEMNAYRKSLVNSLSSRHAKHLKKRNFWMAILLSTSVVFACFLSWQLWETWSVWKEASQRHAVLQKELITWEAVTQKYPGYRDAYFEAAVVAYQLGDKGKVEGYLQKVLAIDPNFTPAQQLKALTK